MPDKEIIDRSLKALMERAAPTLANYLGLPVRADHLRSANTALSIPELRSDGLFLDEQTVHSVGMQLEYQMYPDRRQLRKWYAKNAAANYDPKRRVPLVVLYLKRGRWRHPPHCLDLSEGRLVTRFEFTALNLWDLEAEIRQGALKMLALLLVLCEDKPTVATLQEEMTLIQGLDVPQRAKADLIGIAMAMSGGGVASGLLMQVFSKEIGMLKQMGLVEEWIAEGEARGEAEEARRMVRLLAQERFGVVPPGVEARITDGSREECEALVRRIMRGASAQELAE